MYICNRIETKATLTVQACSQGLPNKFGVEESSSCNFAKKGPLSWFKRHNLSKNVLFFG